MAPVAASSVCCRWHLGPWPVGLGGMSAHLPQGPHVPSCPSLAVLRPDATPACFFVAGFGSRVGEMGLGVGWGDGSYPGPGEQDPASEGRVWEAHLVQPAVTQGLIFPGPGTPLRPQALGVLRSG